MVRSRILRFVIVLLLVSGSAVLTAQEGGQQSAKARADELLLYNKPAEALPLYRAALEQNPQDADLYLNLGRVYELLGRPEEALKTYQKGSTVARIERDRFLNAMGYILHKLERYREAEEQYGRALEYNPTNYGVYLNRGNTRVKLTEYEKAISDYSSYLTLESRPSQEDDVRRMIGLLRGILEQEQARALVEEEQRRQEAARQKELLDSVLSSLDDVTDDTQSISAGAEEIEEPDVEIDLVE